MACPNENSVEWKIMVRNHGRIEARRIWDDLNKNIEEGSSENFPDISSEERKSFVENRGNTSEGVLNELRATQDKFIEDKAQFAVPKKGHLLSSIRKGEELSVERYVFIDENGQRRTVENRVTDIQDVMFRRNKSREEADKINNNPKNIILRERGVNLHDAAQNITEELKRGDTPKKPDFLTSAQFNGLVKGVKKILTDIAEVQNRIDKDSKATVLTETIVYDKKQDKAGSIDLLSVFSDGSVGIYDFKFINFVTQDGKVVDYMDKVDMKEESWDAQISEYKRILKEVYGVDLVRRSRVVPANVQYKYERKGNTNFMTDTVHKLEMGNQEYTRPIPLAEELTDDKKLNYLIERLSALKTSLKSQKSKKNKEQTIARIRRVQDSLREMQLKKDFTLLINEINAINSEIQQGIAINDKNDPKYLSLDQITFYINTLKVYSELAESTRGAIKSRTKEEREELSDKELEDKAKLASATAEMAINTLQEKQNEFVLERGKEREIENVLAVQKSSNKLTNQGKYFSDWTHPIFRLAKKEIDLEILDPTRNKLKSTQEELKELTSELEKWGKTKGLTGTDVFNPIISPTTGNLVTEFKTEYWEQLRGARQTKDLKWLKANLYQSEEDKAYFEKQKKEQKIYIEQAYRNKSEKYREEIMNRWEEKNDPENESAWYNEFTRLTVRDAKKWRSKEYSYILENEPLKKYYDFYIKTNEEINRILPTDVKVKRNFVAYIHKDMVDTLAENGLSAESLGGLYQSFVNSMEVREDDLHFGMTDPLTGNQKMIIPILYTKPLTNSKDEIDNSLKSKDLSRSLSLFAGMAYNYEAVSGVEDIILTMREVLSRQPQIEINKWGKIVKNKNTGKINLIDPKTVNDDKARKNDR